MSYRWLFPIHFNSYVLWVYNQYKYIYSYSAGINFRRQILTSKIDPRAVRVKKVFVVLVFVCEPSFCSGVWNL